MYIRSIIFALGGLVLATNVQATIINGDFSAATSLDGWSFLGNVSETDPADPGGNALLSTASGETSTSTINSTLGIDIDAVTFAYTGGTFSNGSFLYQSFTVNGSGVISFDWDFLSDEGGLGGGQPDFAFALISGMGTELLEVYPGTTSLSSAGGFSQSTGVNSKVSPALAAGSYTLGVGVVNVNNNLKDSGLLIDNVVLTDTTVPVPTTVALLGLGLIGLRRRMR